jgi:hypothetical protein
MINAPPESGEFALKQAECGDPFHLIYRFQCGEKLTDGEVKFISKALMATRGESANARMERELRRRRIGKQVAALRAGGMKPKAATGQVMKQYGVKSRTVSSALRVYENEARRFAEIEAAEARKVAEIEAEIQRIMDRNGVSRQQVLDALRAHEARKLAEIEAEASAKKF